MALKAPKGLRLSHVRVLVGVQRPGELAIGIVDVRLPPTAFRVLLFSQGTAALRLYLTGDAP